jgi:acyl-CoA-binding protein
VAATCDTQISRPGGATAKPDDFYRLYGLHMQALSGDNTSERPMWAERGGLDFEGRARWDAWTALAGVPSEKARLRFVRLYYEFSPTALYKDTRATVA